ncbi:SulP family sulfate permease [Agrobacterium vitis]|nr:SulP family sulfate permease [Agrobacterium vitis]MBE1439485.1 SulP family sulfate permease [Agrobacterium vitis]
MPPVLKHMCDSQKQRQVLNAIAFGLIAGIDGLGTSVAFAALIFAGTLSAGFSTGVSVMLLSCVILAAYLAWRSRYPASLAQVQETSIAILAAAVTSAASTMTDAGAPEKIATAFAILAVSTLGTGVLFYLSGRFRFGVLVRFLPYPVIAGFLAGSGWLLLDGALMMMTNQSGYAAIARSLANPFIITIVLPSLIFAGVMAWALRVMSNPAIAPLIMILSVALFYAMLWLNGLPIDMARQLRWLPGLAEAQAGFSLPSPVDLWSKADWWAVLSVLPMLVSVPLISIAGLLLNTSGLEVAARGDIDANAELKITGQANILIGCLGGAPGFTGLGMTLLAGKLGVRSRLAGAATAAILLLTLPFATQIAAGVPLFVAAGLMIMLGAELVYDWAIAARKTLPLLDWMAVLAIVLSMMAFGFMTGMAVGLVFSTVTFVYNYARLPVIRLAASGHDRRSSTDRSCAANSILDQHGHLIHMIELQGYLFFGTVEQVVRAVKTRFACAPKPHVLLLDFRNVSGIDSAAIAGFINIFSSLSAENVEIILSPMNPDVECVLNRVNDRASSTKLQAAADLDHALEDAEDRLLARYCGVEQSVDIAAQLVGTLGPHPRLHDLVAAMERMELEAGTFLINAGEVASDIFVLATGRVKVEITLPNGRRLRLRSMEAGAVLGEVAFYLGGKRTADVIIETRASLFRLTDTTLKRLEAEDPTLAVLAHRLFASTLAERLTLANRMVQLSNT